MSTQQQIVEAVSAADACSECNGRGMVERVEVNHGREYRVTLPCPPCKLRNDIATRVPAAYRDARLNHFPEGVRSAIDQWLARPTAGLLLNGPCGTGKTYLAWAALMVWWAMRRQGKFVKAEGLYSQMRDAYATKLSEESVLGEVFEARLLVLDDICSGSLSDHERRMTLRVLDVRGDDARPTIVTTNSALEKISAWDDRIASRLSAYAWVPLEGKDWRVKA